jgi:hypothetical protein
MIFFWLLHIVLLSFFVIAQFLFQINIVDDTVLLSFLILSFLPAFVPLVNVVREDVSPMRSVFTKTGLIGSATIVTLVLWWLFGFHIEYTTAIFILIWAFSVFFRVESRIFFGVALVWLFCTMSALIFDKTELAESMSIWVYLALLIGVSVEIIAPWFERLHDLSRPLVDITPEFRQWYYSALSEYAWIMTIWLHFFFFISLLGRGIIWSFDYQMLLYLVFGICIFFALYLLSQDKRLQISDFTAEKFSAKYYRNLYINIKKYSIYWITGLLCFVWLFLINWNIVWNLPLYTLIGSLLFIISMSMISYISYPFFHKK